MSAVRSDVSDAGIPGGPLRRLDHPGGDFSYSLAYCPVCGPEVSFEGATRPSDHISKHDPEDFGLKPSPEGSP